MSKRDDDSQADMEVGMTTAERRRRRRRGGGLRVPSDNVPRRSNPPVVAPVPEDPSLAMSIAYSFSSDASEPVHLPDGTDQRRAPPGEAEAMPTVIDPISAPIEQQDFEMKTREMTAVDLEALGLDDPAGRSESGPLHPGPSGTATTQPMAPMDGAAGDPGLPGVGVEVRFRKLEPPRTPRAERSGQESEVLSAMKRRPSSVEVELDLADGGTTLDEPVIDDADEATSIAPPPNDPKRRERLRTVALSDDDLEEVREAVRGSSASPPAATPPTTPPAIPSVTTSQSVPVVRLHPPTPAPSRPHTPTPPPPIGGALAALVPPPPLPTAIPPPPPPTTIPPATTATQSQSLGTPPPPPRTSSSSVVAQSAAAELWGEKPPKSPKDPTPVGQPLPPVLPLAPLSTIPPPVKAPVAASVGASKDDDGWTDAASSTQPLSAADLEKADEPLSVPEIDIQELADRAESSGEIEVSIEEADEVKTTLRGGLTPPGERKRPPSGPPPAAPPAASTQPGTPPPSPGAKDHAHHPPPPPPAAHHTKPPSPPPVKGKDPAAPPIAPAPARTTPGTGKAARGKPWFIDLFDEDYLRTLPFLTPQATQAEAEFVAEAMGLTPGAQVLDVGCGYGRHAMELAARGFHVVGLDLSTPLLVRGGEEAQRRGLQINFVRGDMRELDFDGQFDGAYCLFSTFGYFDDETNKKTVANIARALKPGGRVLIEILNRDYVIADLPTRVWWEGDGCVVLEEVELNYFSSRIQVNRSVVFDDGRQLEQEISVRAYALHEVGKLMHAAGFRVLEVSGGYQTRGRFFGNQSRHIIVLAERKETAPAS